MGGYGPPYPPLTLMSKVISECFEAQKAHKWNRIVLQMLFECSKASKNEDNTLFNHQNHPISVKMIDIRNVCDRVPFVFDIVPKVDPKNARLGRFQMEIMSFGDENEWPVLRKRWKMNKYGTSLPLRTNHQSSVRIPTSENLRRRLFLSIVFESEPSFRRDHYVSLPHARNIENQCAFCRRRFDSESFLAVFFLRSGLKAFFLAAFGGI